MSEQRRRLCDRLQRPCFLSDLLGEHREHLVVIGVELQHLRPRRDVALCSIDGTIRFH
jgi:hypothetical protein